MKSKRYTALAMATVIVFSLFLENETTVNAQTLESNLPLIEQENDADEIVSFNEELSIAMDQYKSNDSCSVRLGKNRDSLIASDGDSYEINNGPAVATTGRYNQVTYATIHNVEDVDWYKIEVTDATEPISLILTNIPTDRDYDMFLVQYDDINGITAMYYNLQSGNTPETLYGTVPETGTYYVVIQPDTTVADNYSDSPYKMYVGDYYRTDDYGYVDTGLDIDFGYIAVGNTTPVYKGWYSYDLSNSTAIPDGSIVREIYLTDRGNGAYWIGFFKILAAGGQGIQLEEKIGQIDLMYSGDNELLVKQEWLIGGHILASTNFIWEPSILITYKFPVTIENLNYL